MPYGGIFDPARVQKELRQLEKEMGSPAFWQDGERAGKVAREFEIKKKQWETMSQLEEEIENLTAFAQNEHFREAPAEIQQLQALEAKIDQLEKEKLMQGEWDLRDAYLTIHSGAGGVDAADWSSSLLRMYLRFAERHGFRAIVLEKTPHQEAGIKSALVKIEGPYAYGFLKAEKGVHRLVRLSPFNAQNLRQTSFALVDVLPDLGEVEVKLAEKDVKVETFRASSHGGQSVNTTDSAVRLIHLPTGISVSVQNERSQAQNKATAMKILRMRLKRHLAEEKKSQERELRVGGGAEFGHQIRSYILHPYKQIKDHRSGFESARVEAVLDGDLDEVIESVLTKAG